ncbi:MAG: 50S ribosomal protein L25 [Spirochaetaceae bacterium]|nr:MAG: 50S ribosomal protein L25 [Spirochaetaceae bacterium]
MEQIVVQAAERTERKKGPIGRLRRSGRIPAVIYGQQQHRTISVDAHEFINTFKHINESTIITLQTESGGVDVLVKSYDEDLMSGTIQHIDFYEIARGKLLKTHIPIHLEGKSKGVREGGILEVQLHELEIECLPKDIPADVKIDIAGLELGHSVHVSDIVVPTGVKVLSGIDQVVATVAAPRAQEEPEDEVVEEAAITEEPEDSEE